MKIAFFRFFGRANCRGRAERERERERVCCEWWELVSIVMKGLSIRIEGVEIFFWNAR